MKHVLRILPLALFLTPFGALAHEVWLDTDKWQMEPADDLVVSLKNGEDFDGVELSWLDRRMTRFDMVTGDGVTPLQGRAGDIPAVQTTAPDAGLAVLAYASTHSTVRYKTWEKFMSFANHKDLARDIPDIAMFHQTNTLPLADFKEVYWRHSKALLGVADAKGTDRKLGLETEFVALTNPYTDDMSGGFRAVLLYQGSPRDLTQVEVFARAPDKSVTVTRLRTDAAGVVTVPVTAGHTYLLDSVVLRRPDPALAKLTGAIWETHWAALTFQVPQ